MIGIRSGSYWYTIGSADFLHAFFSTIAYNLEDNNWGLEYPYLMNDLYMGELKKENVSNALKELKEIKEKLKKLPAKKVVWDIEDLEKQPPWGDNISSDITDLSNYFVTSDGKDLIYIMQCALERADRLKEDVKITSL